MNEPIELQREPRRKTGTFVPFERTGIQGSPNPVQQSALVAVEHTYKLLNEARARIHQDVVEVEQHFHAAIKDALTAGVSQNDLAELLGLSKQRMSQIAAEITGRVPKPQRKPKRRAK